MKVAIVGYGKMGREVEAVLISRDHQAIVVPRGDALPSGCDVGIDFTRPEAVSNNVDAALAAGMRYVVGTTGWSDALPAVSARVQEAGGGLVHAANFSLGVNLFFRIVRQTTALLARFPEYDPYVLERHHRQKRDAPSGTALVLADIIESTSPPQRQRATSIDGLLPAGTFGVSAVRAGGIVGEHTVGFDAGVDEILIEHRARSRRGFAHGAVLAAEWIVGRQGVYDFEAVLDDLTR